MQVILRPGFNWPGVRLTVPEPPCALTTDRAGTVQSSTQSSCTSQVPSTGHTGWGHQCGGDGRVNPHAAGSQGIRVQARARAVARTDPAVLRGGDGGDGRGDTAFLMPPLAEAVMPPGGPVSDIPAGPVFGYGDAFGPAPRVSAFWRGRTFRPVPVRPAGQEPLHGEGRSRWRSPRPVNRICAVSIAAYKSQSCRTGTSLAGNQAGCGHAFPVAVW